MGGRVPLCSLSPSQLRKVGVRRRLYAGEILVRPKASSDLSFGLEAESNEKPQEDDRYWSAKRAK